MICLHFAGCITNWLENSIWEKRPMKTLMLFSEEERQSLEKFPIHTKYKKPTKEFRPKKEGQCIHTQKKNVYLAKDIFSRPKMHQIISNLTCFISFFLRFLAVFAWKNAKKAGDISPPPILKKKSNGAEGNLVDVFLFFTCVAQ